MDGLPESSPLDRRMWAFSAIDRAWSRKDSLELASLANQQNVAEWLRSSPARRSAFPSLVDAVRRDVVDWDATPLGVIPAGVGGLSLALRVNGRDAVGKWIAERQDLQRRHAMALLLASQELGPQVLASSADGFLMERVVPGTPLRSLGASLNGMLAAARLIPTLRRLTPPPDLELEDPRHDLEEMVDLIDEAHVDTDGFGRRAREAVEALPRNPSTATGVGHGDLQLGNVLVRSGGSGLALIDASGALDGGEYDAARLLVHTTADALGSGETWRSSELAAVVAELVEVDLGLLAATCRARAAVSAWYIRSTVPSREWEWRALDAVYADLS